MSATLEGEKLIIDVPNQLSAMRRVGEAGLSALAAAVWLVVLRPVLLVGIWYLGFEAAYTHMVKLQGWHNRPYFELIAALAFGLAAALFGWSRWSAYRHRGRHLGEGTAAAASDAELAKYFGISEAALARLRQSAALSVERPARAEVVFTSEGGTRVCGRHDPLGPPAARRARDAVTDASSGGAARPMVNAA